MKLIQTLGRTGAVAAFALGIHTGQAATVNVGELTPPLPVGDQWSANIAGGGTATIVDLTGLGGNLENSQPLPVSALRLTTGPVNNPDRAEVYTAQNFGLASSVLTSIDLMYSYYKSSTDVNKFAAPAIKLDIFNPMGSGVGSFDSYGQLVFEPSWNQPGGGSQMPPVDAWQTVMIDENTGSGGDASGGWWWTGGFGIGSSAGGPPLRSLSEWATAFSSGGDAADFSGAYVVALRVGVGTFNLGQTAYVDGVGITTGGIDKKYNFELARTAPVPDGGATLGLLGLAVCGLIPLRRKLTA